MLNAGGVVCRLAAVASFIIALNVESASAQPGAAGDTAHMVRATHAARLSRYYAPYALQAAAAYTPVARLDATLERSEQPGSDVAIAVEAYFDPNDPTIIQRAANYLRSWRYQFGSEGYLGCFDNTDAECQRSLQAEWWRFGVSGGPSFHVWARTRFPQGQRVACSEVTIAFRGTTGSVADWVSNFDLVTGYVSDDHYRQLRRNIDGIIKKITTLDCYRRARGNPPQIVSTGHSLGGGLAQMAALANKPSGPRIGKVIAFNSSPMTGASYMDADRLLRNTEGLEIDRVYQSGEILALVRGAYQQYPPETSRCKPLVRTVVYDLTPPPGRVRLHGMAGLARGMIETSYDDQGTQQLYTTPRKAAGCALRYRTPTSDEDPPAMPSPAEPVVAHGPDGVAVTFAQAFAQPAQSDGPATHPTRARAQKAVPTLRAHKQRKNADRRVASMQPSPGSPR